MPSIFVFRPPDYSFQLRFNQPRFRVKGNGVKGAASPETEPNFYSLPFIKANDASTTLKRDLEGKDALKMEEECECSEPVLCQKKQAEKMMNYNEYDMGDTVFSCQRNSSLAIGIPGIVPQITGYKKPRMAVPSSSFDFSSSTTVYTFSRRASESNDFCPRSLLPYLEDTNDRVLCSWNESQFGKRLSETSLSALQSLKDPVLSPSSSPFSLDEMFQQRESLDINTDSIFSELGFDGDWGLEAKLPSRQSHAPTSG
jgi:hypothetical protein